jgi:4-amino-4-deoxy-L-arabinose transferase-like glycosyltransferase
MSRSDKLALLLASLAVMLSAWVSYGIYEGLAQLEDEYAYQWQAQALANGEIKVPSPPEPKRFIVPFVIDFEGERFGKYPLGWPTVLSFGERVGLARMVNPLLAGLAVWLIYRLGQKLLGDRVGLLAAGLTVISPLFLTYTGSILSHTWGLVLSLSLALSWLDLTDERAEIPGWLPTLTAGISLGVLFLSRPWTALGVALPFGIHGLILFIRGPMQIRKRILGVGLIALLVSSLHFAWQFALTGDPLQNPYLLWWPYDRIGFGPGIGVAQGGNTLHQSWLNTRDSLRQTWQDLWGWGRYSWVLLLIGLWAARRQPRLWLVVGVFPALVVVYLAYWVSGPRYFYEGLYSLTLLGAAGLAWLLGWLPDQGLNLARRYPRVWQGVILAGCVTLLIFGTRPYTITRISEIKARYGFSQAALEPFRTPEAQDLTPALIVVHAPRWADYGAYLNLEDPYLSTPFIFAWASPAEETFNQLSAAFPERRMIHYYPDHPGEFYDSPLP